MNPLTVLLATEGTYPFHQGGVSTWCDILIRNLNTVDFTIFSVITDPYMTQKFPLYENATLIKVPLWGTEEPSESRGTRFSHIYLAKQKTTTKIVQEKFIPLFSDLVIQILSEDKNSDLLANVLVELHTLFQQYDFKVLFKHELTWETYKELVMQVVTSKNSRILSEPDLYSLIQSLGWIYRFFNIINIPIPKTTLTHSSAAAFCSLPCILSKKMYGTPFLLTEHGVYLREQYLSLSKRRYSSFLNTFLIRLIRTITDLNFSFADQVSPVCDYNIRWEKRISPHPDRIQTIYNGVDHVPYIDLELPKRESPTVVTLARIDPIKDLKTLLRAAVLVRNKIPQVRFLIYGSVTVERYYEECLAVRKDLELEKTVEFVGHIADVVRAYEKADVVAQSSISEAFPYSVIEAMFAGRAIVSTDVGGIPEAIEGVGVLVPPGDEHAMAEGIIELLGNDSLRQEMGNKAREKALNQFTLSRSLEEYFRSYLKLIFRREENDSKRANVPRMRPSKRHIRNTGLRESWILAERAMALSDTGFVEEAIACMELAVTRDSGSLARPYLMATLTELHTRKLFYLHGQTVEIREVQEKKLEKEIESYMQTNFAVRAYALADNGFIEGAIACMERALFSRPNSLVNAIFLLDMSRWNALLNRVNEARMYLYKYELIMSVRDPQWASEV